MNPRFWTSIGIVGLAVISTAVLGARVKRKGGRTAIAVGAVILLVATAGAILIWAQDRSETLHAAALDAVELLRRPSRVRIVVLQAETGQRGYLLTGNADYLATYEEAKRRLALEMKPLQEGLDGDAELQKIGDLLARDVARKFEELNATIVAYRNKDPAGSLAIVKTNKGLDLMRSIEAACDTLREKLQTRLTIAIRQDSEMAHSVSYGIAGLLIAALLTMLAATLIARRNYEGRLALAAERDRRAEMLDLAGKAGHIGHWQVLQQGGAAQIVWSEETFRIHGCDPALGAPPIAAAIDYFHEDDRGRVAAVVDRALKTGQDFEFEARIRRPDGAIADVLSRGVAVKDADGTVTSLFGVLLDVSRLRQAERGIAAVEIRYNRLADSVPAMVWTKGGDDLLTRYKNRRYEAYFGTETISHAQGLGRYHPDDATTMAMVWDHALSTHTAFEAEARVTRHDGLHRWHKLVAEPTDDATSPDEWVVTATDIDDIVTARQRLEETTGLLNLSLEAASAASWTFSVATKTLNFPPAAAAMLGLEPVAISLSVEEWRALVHERDADTTAAAMRTAVMEGGKVETEFRVPLPQGGTRWLFVTGYAERDADGQIVRLIGLSQDVTRRKLAEADLTAAGEAADAARQQAESANRAKSDFLAAMSHEIRTPLNSILGFTDLMLGRDDLEGEPRRYAEIVNSSGAALLTVINDVLEFSKIEAGQIEIDATPFSPRALFVNALSIVKGLGESKGLSVTAQIDPALPEGLKGDWARIQQVLLNLLNNAIKFTPSGSVVLRVRVESADHVATRLRIAITDTGIGIAKAKQDRLFKRFSQADASISGQYGGSGLGLAISKRLVEAMGGEIDVFSDEGKGSTFWFTLGLPPCAFAARADAGAASKPEVTGHLLLVEDVEINQLLARTLLEDDGHTIDIAASGEEAVAAVAAKPYDLVLMDVQMPGMDGMAATRIIRAMPGFETLPIIAMTANVLREQVQVFLASGMNDHVGKPIDRAELQATIDRWLTIARSRVASARTAAKPPPSRAAPLVS